MSILKVCIHSSLWLWPRLKTLYLTPKAFIPHHLLWKWQCPAHFSLDSAVVYYSSRDQHLWEFHWSYHCLPYARCSCHPCNWNQRHRVTTSKYSFGRLIQGHGLGAIKFPTATWKCFNWGLSQMTFYSRPGNKVPGDHLRTGCPERGLSSAAVDFSH